MANLNAPISETAVANMAAQVLDDVQLNSLDDATPFGRFVGREFGHIRDEHLRAHNWNCVRKRALLAADAVAPEFGWSYSYTMPADCLRVWQIRTTWNEPTSVPHEIEGRKILTNCAAPLPLVYISRPADFSIVDPLCARALGMRIAVLAASRVTGKLSYVDKARGMFAEAMDEAFRANALEGTPEQYTTDTSYHPDSLLYGR